MYTISIDPVMIFILIGYTYLSVYVYITEARCNFGSMTWRKSILNFLLKDYPRNAFKSLSHKK